MLYDGLLLSKMSLLLSLIEILATGGRSAVNGRRRR
jgi:hypothetical protein